ncbi:hypothetical protein BT93_L3324 [Corymbia citriodora subsp. variegata]|uniref:SIS domain-containing protein n=1 Tax=Corymbia citriodora subsp. variegata TaxID=360336 RepID=A0A8T0CVM4_CORYI|nr:hypothetical protein BT93_L3324 [Corymbia citriodora subsp. variegata]
MVVHCFLVSKNGQKNQAKDHYFMMISTLHRMGIPGNCCYQAMQMLWLSTQEKFWLLRMVKLFTRRPASVQRALSVLEMEVEQIHKGNHEHYMQKEIHEQPESLTTTMRGRLIRGGTCKAKTVLLGGLKDHLKTIRRSWRIVFIGCGTSYNAALAARPILEKLSGILVTMEIASDLLDRQGPMYREDTAVFVSQSGETADTLHALEYALQNAALCVGITNTVGSAIARKTHCGVHINAGAEIGVASTKAYTSQIVVMAMLALAIGGDAISNQARREAIIDCLFDLPNKVRDMLKLDQEMKDLAKLLIAEQSLLMFGRGYNYATALERSLKVKEVALMHSEGILAGEMKHGPLALVDESLPIVVIATRDACFSKQQSVIQQLHARKGRLIVMCSSGDATAVSRQKYSGSAKTWHKGSLKCQKLQKVHLSATFQKKWIT